MARTTYHGLKQVGTDAASSDVIELDGDDCLYFEVPTGSSITELSYYISVRPPGQENYEALKDGTGQGGGSAAPSLVVQTVSAGNTFQAVANVNGAAKIKLVGDAEGEIWVQSKRMSQS